VSEGRLACGLCSACGARPCRLELPAQRSGVSDIFTVTTVPLRCYRSDTRRLMFMASPPCALPLHHLAETATPTARLTWCMVTASPLCSARLQRQWRRHREKRDDDATGSRVVDRRLCRTHHGREAFVCEAAARQVHKSRNRRTGIARISQTSDVYRAPRTARFGVIAIEPSNLFLGRPPRCRQARAGAEQQAAVAQGDRGRGIQATLQKRPRANCWQSLTAHPNR